MNLMDGTFASQGKMKLITFLNRHKKSALNRFFYIAFLNQIGYIGRFQAKLKTFEDFKAIEANKYQDHLMLHSIKTIFLHLKLQRNSGKNR